jgi:hypothetical protein
MTGRGSFPQPGELMTTPRARSAELVSSGSGMNSHPKLDFRFTFQRSRDFYGALQGRRFKFGAKNQRHSITGWQAY